MSYRWGLTARTIHILNDLFFAQNDTIRFGLIDCNHDELLKETFGGAMPAIFLLKDGMVYQNYPF
jgi:hypothetical protein